MAKVNKTDKTSVRKRLVVKGLEKSRSYICIRWTFQDCYRLLLQPYITILSISLYIYWFYCHYFFVCLTPALLSFPGGNRQGKTVSMITWYSESIIFVHHEYLCVFVPHMQYNPGQTLRDIHGNQTKGSVLFKTYMMKKILILSSF